MIKINSLLPVFTLYNQNNKIVTDNNFLGCHSVLYFYPKDNTPGCTKEACSFSENLALFNELEVPIFGVSPDSVASHKKFHDKFELKFQLISDPDLHLAKAIGVYGEKKMYGKTYMGILRTTFIIDEQKKIVAIFENVKVKDHTKAVLEKLKELKKRA